MGKGKGVKGKEKQNTQLILHRYLFGENAALDVGGSFLATTADSYIFENGFEYSASNPDAPPLLTINLPVGVQFGSNPETIEVQGTGHNLTLDEFTFIPIRDNRPVGLEVKSGNTLALLGGKINLTGGNLTAERGNIELGSVGEAKTINLNPTDHGFTADYGEINNFSDLNLTQASSIDVSGSGAGSLNLRGKNISVSDSSAILASTLGADNGEKVEITASDSIEIIGTDEELFPSRLFSISEGMGDAGDVTINGDRLIVKDGSQIASGTFGEGNAGNLTINVSEIEIIKDPDNSLFTGLFSDSQGKGDAGDLTINGDLLVVKDGGSISASTENAGSAGNLNITANNIEVTGTSADGNLLSNITASSETDSPAGSLDITTDQLNVIDNAEILVSNTDLGDAGNLTITANEINLEGGGSLNAEVNAGTQGNINLTTDNIFLRNNSEINAKASGTATGGNITIDNTDNIVLLENSQIIADAIEGNGGNINIATQGLFVSPDSLISASSEFGLDGQVEIDEVNGDRKFELNELPNRISDLTNLITLTCMANDNNAVAVIGNGGIPNSPYQTQSLNTTWYDLRPVKQEKAKVASVPKPLTEATTTMIDSNGELELVALTPLSTHCWIESSCSN